MRDDTHEEKIRKITEAQIEMGFLIFVIKARGDSHCLLGDDHEHEIECYNDQHMGISNCLLLRDFEDQSASFGFYGGSVTLLNSTSVLKLFWSTNNSCHTFVDKNSIVHSYNVSQLPKMDTKAEMIYRNTITKE